MPGDAKRPARRGKLLPPHPAQLFAGGGPGPIGARLPVGQADYIRLDASIGSQRQRSAESEALVIGMRDDTHQF
jgi:hypothetical protein